MKTESALYKIAAFFPTETFHYFLHAGPTSVMTTSAPGAPEPPPEEDSSAAFVPSSKLPRTAVAGRLLSGVIGMSLLCCGTALGGQSVSLSWNAVTNTAVAGYNFYLGTNSGNYTTHFDVGTNTTITLTGLKECRTNYFTVAAYDSHGDEGPRSAESSYIVPGVVHLVRPSAPGQPAGITFPVAVGHNYVVQASTDLVNWATLWQTGVSASNAWVTFQDPQTSSFPERFYRLVLQ